MRVRTLARLFAPLAWTLALSRAGLAQDLPPDPAQRSELPPWEIALGGAAERLRPDAGSHQNLSGPFIGINLPVARSWSLETTYIGQLTGSEAGAVELRQWLLLGGARYTRPLGLGFAVYGQLQAGYGRLFATQANANVLSTTWAVAPGLGLDLALNPYAGIRVQYDWVITGYGSSQQYSSMVSLGLVIKIPR